MISRYCNVVMYIFLKLNFEFSHLKCIFETWSIPPSTLSLRQNDSNFPWKRWISSSLYFLSGIGNHFDILKKIYLFKIQGVFFNWDPQCQYQKENRQAANHSTGFTGTAAVIGWFAVYFWYWNWGVPVKKKTPSIYFKTGKKGLQFLGGCALAI